MYTPAAFALNDRAALVALMAQNSFALLVSTDADGRPVASHLPILYEAGRGPQGTLIGHMARANPQWRGFAEEREVLAVFAGPHAYVSPSWYASQPNVPTWNYLAVHAYGTPRLLPDPADAKRVLQRLVETYESGFAAPWRMELPADYERAMVQGIAAFEIAVTRLEGKAKLSQNRKPDDRAAALAGLAAQPDEGSQAIAAAMRAAGVGG